jgi:hypothetical protein
VPAKKEKRLRRGGEARRTFSRRSAPPLFVLGRRFFVFLAITPVVLALEAFYPTGGVHVLHLAGEEGVTGGADFHMDLPFGAAGLEGIATAARHRSFYIFGMDIWFHDRSFLLPAGLRVL